MTLISFFAFSQNEEKKEIELKWSGYVKSDFFWDSRQTVSAREGHFLLFPAAVSKDPDGKDINATPNLNFLAIQSRLSLSIAGPDALGAKTSAKIEGDFFGQLNDNINLFRLRHAYLKLKWENSELLFGQYWIPMFVTGCFPGTVSFNTGVPFQPFGRNPQIRFSHKIGKIKFIVIASTQRDYASRGVSGATGTYLRNSSMPELNGQIHFGKGKTFLAGVGAGYKQILPQIATGNGYVTNQTVGGFTSIAFMKIKTSPVTLKFEGVYGQNFPDVLSIGGFAITDSTDVTKGFVTYTPFTVMSSWMDIETNGKKMKVGVYVGYSQNLGTGKQIIGAVYGLGTTIQSIFRVSPRIIYNVGQVRFALETEYTSANYAASYDVKGVPEDLTSADNLRILFAAYYFFK
ncbi:MAG: hypothetical protein DRP35_06660 [Candidatus Zixiibacteriota bacterium]|nr:MAG: hypothetical protein DRP35_06660 [candidate division Zixibacteria bacterium]